ncbi:MAG: site-2 protease family protein [Halothiobacillaceae bacterium]|nr:site-2 protease family protein [Halothiobacillaceae bacterium]
MELNLIQQISIWALPVLLAITLHEAAHGYAAWKLGDDTAYRLGRVTLNPLRHIDPIGTVILPLLMLVLSGFVFGWARPVPVVSSRLRAPRRDMIWVALAGPGANLALALFWALMMKLGHGLDASVPLISVPLVLMGQAGVVVNVLLMILNLLPIPPLDGGRVVANLLPARPAMLYERIEPFGFVILLLLLFTGTLSWLIGPAMALVQGWMYAFAGFR